MIQVTVAVTQATKPREVNATSVKWAWLFAKLSGTAPLVLVVPLATSAIRNSLPIGKSIRARCSAPVTGFFSGSTEVSTRLGTLRRAVRCSMSISISIGLNIGSWYVVHIPVDLQHD